MTEDIQEKITLCEQEIDDLYTMNSVLEDTLSKFSEVETGLYSELEIPYQWEDIKSDIQDLIAFLRVQIEERGSSLQLLELELQMGREDEL